MGLRTGWKFNLKEHRQLAWIKLVQDAPYCVIGSLECRMFSTLQHLNKAKMEGNREWIEKFEKEHNEAVLHLQLCCHI